MAYSYGTVTNCKVRNGQTRKEYECRLGYEVQSQSIANNTSTVKLRLECRSISSSYTTKGSSGLTSKIDGTTVKNNASVDMSNTNTWQNFGERTITVTHNADGTYSASKTGSFTCTAGSSNYSLSSGSASVTVAPAKIPRYGTANQSLNYKTETTINMNWSSDSTVDYIWYSKDNGSNWTGVDVADGTSGTYNITGLTPNTAYNIKTRIRRKDSQLTTDSTALSVTTYKAPSNSVASKTETSVTVNWSCDSTADYIWASINGGSSWFDISSVNATSGTYTISGLSANTTYNVKTRCRRSATQTTYDASTLSVTTYNYPYCTSSPNFIIGNAVKLDFYNPLNRTIGVELIGNGDVIIGKGTGAWTTVTGFNDTGSVQNQYASIPDKTSSTYKVQVTYNTAVMTRNNGNTYSIKGTEKPVFTNFTYKDTNTTVSNVLGSDQYLVKGLSNLQVTIPSANKMVGSNSATPKNYIATLDTLNKSADYSTNNVTLNLGTPISAGTKRLTVTAYDYRTLYTSAYKDVIIFEHNKPVVNVDIKRLNNFEAETTLKVSGTYSRIIIDGTDKNSIIGATYRYRELGGDWSSETNFNCTINNGEFTCNDVVLSLDNSKEFEFEISIKDKLQTVNRDTYPVGVGQAVFFISSNKKQCYINGKLVKGSLEISAVEPTEGEELWIKSSETINLTGNFETGNINTDTGVKIDGSSFLRSNDYIEVEASKEYILQYTPTSSNIQTVICEYDKNKTYLGMKYSGTNKNEFKTETTTKYILVRIAETNLKTDVILRKKIQEIYARNENNEYEEIYNFNKINKQNYLSKESLIGTWIDGKPLYRKVTTLSTNWVTGVNTFNTGITNMDTLVNSQIYFRYSSTYNIWYSNYDQYQNQRYLNSGSSYELTLGNGLTVEEAYLITEYTKTTD